MFTTVSGNAKLLKSLAAVMEKVQRIAEVTADAVDALAKASEMCRSYT